jgi:hypothetical protein
MSYLEQIKQLLPYKHYFIDDFWEICPFDFETLTYSRHHPKVVYLHVGLVWARLSGMGTVEAGEYFKRHHSTVVYAEQRILNSLINKKFGYVEYGDIINEIGTYYESTMAILEVEKTDDVYQDHYASLVNMENKWYQLRNTKIWKNS